MHALCETKTQYLTFAALPEMQSRALHLAACHNMTLRQLAQHIAYDLVMGQVPAQEANFLLGLLHACQQLETIMTREEQLTNCHTTF